jgi:diacylglycerol kinase (ATP)
LIGGIVAMADSFFSIGARARSFRAAIAGIGFVLKTQHNSWLHLIAAIVVCVAGVALNITAEDWRWLVIAIALVWFAEVLNTAFEHLCDVVSPEFHPSVKKSKDIAAGAVLICAIGSAALGVMIFLPYVKF